MRLAESARIDAELARRYRGLAPRIAGLNRSLLERLHPESLSTMLVRAALDLDTTGEVLDSPLVQMAAVHFAPVREHGADVMTSVRQIGALYNWLQELIRQARERGEGDPLTEEEAERMRNDLIKGMKGSESQTAGDGEDGDQGEGGGEPDQNIQMDVSGKQSKGGQGRALSPEELRKLIEQGAEIKPSQGDGGADGDGMYLTQLTGKQLRSLSSCASSSARSALLQGRDA